MTRKKTLKCSSFFKHLGYCWGKNCNFLEILLSILKSEAGGVLSKVLKISRMGVLINSLLIKKTCTKHLSVTAGTCESRWRVHHEILEPGVGEAQFHDAVVKEAHGETAKANKRRQGSAWRK